MLEGGGTWAQRTLRPSRRWSRTASSRGGTWDPKRTWRTLYNPNWSPCCLRRRNIEVRLWCYINRLRHIKICWMLHVGRTKVVRHVGSRGCHYTQRLLGRSRNSWRTIKMYSRRWGWAGDLCWGLNKDC